MEIIRSLYNSLLPNQRKESLFQIFLMIISMIFELLSITLVLPVIAIIADDNFLEKYPLIEYFIFFVDVSSKNQVLIYFMLVFLIIYIIKSITIGYIINLNYKFIYGLQVSFSHRLFKGYIYHPLIFHLKKNSAQLIQNSILIVNNVTSSLVSIIQLMSELVTSISICIFILLISPLSLILSLIIFVPTIYIFLKSLRKKLKVWGENFQFHDGNRIQLLQQGLSTVKEIKLVSKEDFFSNSYLTHTVQGASYARKQQFFQAIPRLFIEVLMIIALTSIVVLLVLNNNDFDSILILLGVFAAASFRLLPSMNRITSSIQTLRYCSSFIKTLESELIDIEKIIKPKKSNKKLSFKNNLIVKNLTFKYPDSNNYIIKNLCFEISKGSMVGIIGSTGAGKSTFVNVLLGLLRSTNGTILVDNKNIHDNINSWQNNIGYVPQTISLIDDSLRRNIAFGLDDDKIDDDKVIDSINRAELKKLLSTLEKGLDTMLGERGVRFSGGERQRIGIARALYNNPDILVFDEATSSLDTKTEKEIMNSINSFKNDKTIIMITHRYSTLDGCDKVFKLSNGNFKKIK